ncbi:LysR family substrate-binding domain-containing protein [Nostoc sp. CHAB 5844]|nr:LysR family substrate-binding domain-containing protein [Nostoc sp. CHAB 5844]
MRDRIIHLGFAHPLLEDSTLSQKCIHKASLIVALPEMHPLAKQKSISVRSLVNESFIMFPRYLGSGLYDQILNLCQTGNFSPKVTQEAIQMQTIIGLVSASMGIAIVPSLLQNLQRNDIAYRPMKEKTPVIEIAMVWQPDNITPVLHEFFQVVRTVCSYGD